MKKISAQIERVEVETNPSCDIFTVTLEDEGYSWVETLKSETDLRIYLRGVEAGCGISGVLFSMPDIPLNISKRFREA
jgi:hypothetical protein